jgi:hypothetical protein
MYLFHTSTDSLDVFLGSLPSTDFAPRRYWRAVPGLRSALGLDEDPVSPQMARGGDTSLFSLPSDSANPNDDTPHTSNVSMATTITTVLSPDKNLSQRHQYYQNRNSCFVDDKKKLGMRQTFESMIWLLGRLEAACHLLLNVKDKLKAADEIKQIYLDFLHLPVSDLKDIAHLFELTYTFLPFSTTTRTVSEDLEEDRVDPRHVEETVEFHHAALPAPMSSASDPETSEVPFTQSKLSQEILRVNVIENDCVGINETVECDLWTPRTEDMNSLRTYLPLTDEGHSTIESIGEGDNERHEALADDLRRAVGSFDHESIQENREDVPSWDESDANEHESVNEPLRTNGVRRNGNTQRVSRKTRGFWRGRILGSRQRRVTSVE